MHEFMQVCFYEFVAKNIHQAIPNYIFYHQSYKRKTIEPMDQTSK